MRLVVGSMRLVLELDLETGPGAHLETGPGAWPGTVSLEPGPVQCPWSLARYTTTLGTLLHHPGTPRHDITLGTPGHPKSGIRTSKLSES